MFNSTSNEWTVPTAVRTSLRGVENDATFTAENIEPPTFPEMKIAETISITFCITIVCFGLLGNSLSLAVCIRKRFRSQSTFRWLAALAVADIVLNICDPPWTALRYADWWERDIVTPFLCKARYYIRTSMAQVSAWIIVCISIERLVCVIFPLKINRFAMKFANIGIPTIFLIMFSINIYVIWALDHWGGKCWGSREHMDLYRIRSVMLGVMYSYIPLSLICTINTVIVYNLFKDKGIDKSKQSKSEARSKKKERAASKMLVVISVAFVVFTMPVMVVNPIQKELKQNPNTRYTEHYARIFLLFYAFLVPCANLNHAINFILYCATGEAFRKETARMLGCTFLVGEATTTGAVSQMGKSIAGGGGVPKLPKVEEEPPDNLPDSDPD